MSNFQCPQCGMTNIDCGEEGYKTPKELEYEKAFEEIEEIVKETCRKRCTNDCLGTRKHCGYGAIFNIINKAKGEGNGR